MKNIFFVLSICVFTLALYSCSKKTHPAKEPAVVVPAKKIKTPVPAAIVVNDANASKTFDGRLYYDLEGHRYWRSNKDGKYYLYNKSMQNNPDFKVKQ